MVAVCQQCGPGGLPCEARIQIPPQATSGREPVAGGALLPHLAAELDHAAFALFERFGQFPPQDERLAVVGLAW